MKLTTIGIDLAKTVFQVHGVTSDGTVLRKRLGRGKLLTFMAQQAPRLVGMEACGGAHHWARELLWSSYQRLRALDEQIKAHEVRIEVFHRSDVASQRLAAVEGIGPLTATALRAAVGDAREFRNGPHLAAWLGLVPRQHSSGHRQVLLGISKRGDRYLRTLLIHGARAVLSRSAGKTDRRSRWLESLKARRGFNRACVALANRNARMVWALLARSRTVRRYNWVSTQRND